MKNIMISCLTVVVISSKFILKIVCSVALRNTTLTWSNIIQQFIITIHPFLKYTYSGSM